MPSKMSAADRNPLAKGCEGCFFLSKYFGCCNYLIYTDKRRPCPGGKDCTVKTTQTPENWEKVLLWDTVLAQKLYKQGATDAEIAKACKAPIGQVKAFRSKHLGPANRKAGEGYGGRPIKWDTEKGLQLWLEGKTLAEIAKEVGSSQTAVSHHATRYWSHLKDQRAKMEAKPRGWDKEKAYRLYCEGATDPAIAAAVGVHTETVRQHRLKNWGPANYNGQAKWDTEKGLELYRQGMSISQIARELGVGRNAVDKYAQRHWRGER